MEGVGIEDGLDHDERIGDIFIVQPMPIEGCLVWTVVEILEELRTTQMEHELK